LVEDIQYRIRRMELGGTREGAGKIEESVAEASRPTAVAGRKS